jgi:hypothetical protein
MNRIGSSCRILSNKKISIVGMIFVTYGMLALVRFLFIISADVNISIAKCYILDHVIP